MPKLENKKVRETREIIEQGFGASGAMVEQSRVIELPGDAELGEGQVQVAQDTPVTDWEKVN